MPVACNHMGGIAVDEQEGVCCVVKLACGLVESSGMWSNEISWILVLLSAFLLRAFSSIPSASGN